MAKSSKQLSVADLERMLNNRRAQLDGMAKKRERLQKELAGVDQLISRLEGTKTKTVSAAKPKKTVKRRRNKTSLRSVVNVILGKNKKGLKLAELHEHVMDTGFKSNSKNFRNVLYQCVYNADEVVHDQKSGLYRLK